MFDFHDVAVGPNGISFPARWRLATGTELSLCLRAEGGKPLAVRGMVVDSEPDVRDPGVYRITLWFLEASEDVPAIVSALSAQHYIDNKNAGTPSDSVAAISNEDDFVFAQGA